MKKFLAAIAIVALFVIPAGAASKPKAAQSVRPLQTFVELEDGTPILANICTVTSISKELHLWLTAAHCVAKGNFFAIDRYQAIIKKVNPNWDLAILYTPDYSLPHLKIAKYNKAPKYGDHVRIWGHPFGFNDIVYVEGIVSSPISTFDYGEYAMFQCTIAPGNSGSAVLNENNEIISVVQVAWGWFPAFEPMFGGVPFSVLKQFLVGELG